MLRRAFLAGVAVLPLAGCDPKTADKVAAGVDFAAAMLDFGGVEVGEAELPFEFFASGFVTQRRRQFSRGLFRFGDPELRIEIHAFALPAARS